MSYNKMNGSVNFWAKEIMTKNTVKHVYKINFPIFYVTRFYDFLCYKILWFFMLQDFPIFYVTKWFYDFLCYKMIFQFSMLQDFMIFMLQNDFMIFYVTRL